MRRFAWICYVVLLHITLAVAAVKTDLLSKAGQKLGISQEPDWSGLTFAREVHRMQDATVPAGAVVFLGDSITQQLVTAAVAPLSVNFGIGGQRSDQLLQSMDTYGSMTRARHVVLMIGTNDLLQGRERGLGERYRAILANIPPAVPVVMSSVPPLAKVDVRPAVDAARAACAQHHACLFVNAYSAMADKPGMLSDGVHLTPAGYAVWITMLRDALEGVHSLPASVTQR